MRIYIYMYVCIYIYMYICTHGEPWGIGMLGRFGVLASALLLQGSQQSFTKERNMVIRTEARGPCLLARTEPRAPSACVYI